MKLDLSKVRVVDKDDHTTTLKHYAGHEIKVVHKALSRENKDLLEALHKNHDEKKAKRMAKGGAVKDSDKEANYDAMIKQETARAMNAAMAKANNPDNRILHEDREQYGEDMRLRGRAYKAEGGKVPVPTPDQSQPKVPPPMPKIDPQGASGRTWEDVKKTMMNPKSWYADGGEVEGQATPEQLEAFNQAMGNMGMKPQTVNIPGAPPSASMPSTPPTMGQVMSDVGNILMSPAGSKQAETPVWNQQSLSQQEPQLPPQPQGQAPQANMGNMAQQPQMNPQDQDPMGMKGYLKSAQDAIQTQQQGLQKEFQAARQMGEQKAQADVSYQAQMQRMQNQFQSDVDANMKNISGTIEDIRNSHINPKAYQESMSTGSRVASAIGMIAGGLGQGFIGGPNPAMEFLNKQIDRDIHAQEYNINKKTTLLNAYQAQFRDKMAANQMTRATLSALYASQMDQAAHQAATPAAQANLLKQSGDLKMKAADLTRQATLNEYMYGLGNSGGTGQGGAPQNPMERENAFRRQQSFLMMTNPELAKQRAAAHVPGIGDAPLGTAISDGTKKEFASHQKFDQAAQDLYKFVKQHRGELSSLHPIDKAQAETKAMILQSLFREGTLGTVYREGEQPLLDKAIKGNPINMLNYFTELPKLEELMKSNAHAENALRGVYGLPNRPEPTPNQHQEGEVVPGKDGKQYRRQGNYMVPIK